MAIQDKHHALLFGIIAGIPAIEQDGEKLLSFMDAPYEFRDHLLPEWISARGWMLFDAPECAVRLRADGDGLAYTWQSWAAFVDWTAATLGAAAVELQHAQGFTHEEAELEWRRSVPCLADLRTGAMAYAQPDRARQLPAAVTVQRSFKGGLPDGVPIGHTGVGAAAFQFRYQREIPLEWCGPLVEWLAAQPDRLDDERFAPDEAGELRIDNNLFTGFLQWSCRLLTQALRDVQPAPVPRSALDSLH
ncbi:hypothetical protein AC233_00320 [Burkholderia sp. HB1]|nr:hypothetical protein AC233_00320 [Burkholderia sp. HB1]